MKKLWTLMAMVAVLASCSQDETASPLNTYTLTGYADVESRTAFGAPIGDKIPFQWSADDKIYVGNTQSNAITNGGNSATFTFNGTPSGTNVYYNMTGSSNQANVLTEQTVGNLGTNGDFGYGIVDHGSFTLNHATSYVWFDVTSTLSNVTLESIKVSADVNIAGKATWSGSSFGAITDGSNTIELTVNQALSSSNSNVWAMVVLPNLQNQSFKVTYKLKVENETKYCRHTVTENSNFISGKTLKVSLDITDDILTDYAELRYLTFEDGSEKFEPYECTFNYAMGFYEETKLIEKWSDYIPTDGQYGNGHGSYEWYDEGNTELAFVKPEIDSWWGISGHAGISNYVGTDEDINNYEDDNFMFEIDLQAYNVKGGANGSKNFCSHYGYLDPEEYATQYSPEGVLPGIQFMDGQARVIDHMYVTNTTYSYAILVNGEMSFGGNYMQTEQSWFKVIAYGYDSFGDTEPTQAEFFLMNTNSRIITDWTKWDLSGLGKVVRVEFNLVAYDNGYGRYGLVLPAYFAYDDVAVRF